MLIEVRCCCQPTKLLGHLDLACFTRESDLPMQLTLAHLESVNAHFELTQDSSLLTKAIEKRTTLPIATIFVNAKSYKAVKAEGMTIEELSRLREFRPAID